MESTKASLLRRVGKTFQRASNAGVNFFLAQVKCVPNFTLFCCKSELCCDFALFWVIPKGFYLVKLNIAVKRGLFLLLLHNCCFYRCMAVLFCSYLLSNTFYAVLLQIYFCRKLLTFSGKILFAQTLLG